MAITQSRNFWRWVIAPVLTAGVFFGLYWLGKYLTGRSDFFTGSIFGQCCGLFLTYLVAALVTIIVSYWSFPKAKVVISIVVASAIIVYGGYMIGHAMFNPNDGFIKVLAAAAPLILVPVLYFILSAKARKEIHDIKILSK